MTENSPTPITKAQTAAQELLARTQDATRQFIDTVTDSTERLSADAKNSAREAADHMSEVGDRFVDLRKKADPTSEQVTTAVNELIAWARRNSDRLVADFEELRHGLEARLAPVTIVTKSELAALETRVAETEQALAKALKANAAKPATKKAPAKKAAARKSPAKKPASAAKA